jgi:hypothetical protein
MAFWLRGKFFAPSRDGGPFEAAFRLPRICIKHANSLSKIFDGLATRTICKTLTGLLGLVYR